MHELVILHVASDARLAGELATRLRGAGYAVWLTERHDPLAPAGDVAASLAAIERASAVLPLITSMALSERDFDQQVDQARMSGRPCLPILKDVSVWEFELRRPAWTKEFGGRLLVMPSAGVEAVLPALLGALEQHDLRPEFEPASTPVESTTTSVPPPTTATPLTPTPPTLTPPSSLDSSMLLATPTADWLQFSPTSGSVPGQPAESIDRPSGGTGESPASSRPAASDWLTMPQPTVPEPAQSAMMPQASDEPPDTALIMASSETLPSGVETGVELPPPLPARKSAAVVEGRAPLPTSPPRPTKRPGCGCVGWTLGVVFLVIGVPIILVLIALIWAVVTEISTNGASGGTRSATVTGIVIDGTIVTGAATAPTETLLATATRPLSAVATPALVGAATATSGRATPVVRPPIVTSPSGGARQATAVPATMNAQRTLRDGFGAGEPSLLPPESDDPARYRRGPDQDEYRLATVDATTAPAVLRAPVIGTHADVILSVDVRLIGDTANRTLVLACRDQDGTGATGYGLVVNPGRGQVALVRWAAGRETRLSGWTTTRLVRQGNQTNRVELSCQGSAIKARINGSEMMSVQDATYRTGQLWLGVATGGSRAAATEARFDNLQVLSSPASSQ